MKTNQPFHSTPTYRASALLEQCGDAAEHSRRFAASDNQRDVNSGPVADPNAVSSQASSPHCKTLPSCERLRLYFAPLLGLFVGSFMAAAAEFKPPIMLESPDSQRDGWFGMSSVSSVPDLNGDSRPDILICALGEFAGRVYLYDGVSRELLRDLRSPDEALDSRFGSAACGIGDVSGDGQGDVVVSTSDGENRVYVFDGATGDVIRTLEPVENPEASLACQGTYPPFQISTGVDQRQNPSAAGLCRGLARLPQGGERKPESRHELFP